MSKSIIPRSTPVASNALVAATIPCALHAVNVANGTTAGWVLLYDANAVPADGTVKPRRVWQMAANTSLELRFAVPIQLLTGCTLVYSSTGPFTQTASATAFISADVDS